ncbi:MAG: hypothetical protein AB7T49_15845 [Oligoflexales bacterium]
MLDARKPIFHLAFHFAIAFVALLLPAGQSLEYEYALIQSIITVVCAPFLGMLLKPTPIHFALVVIAIPAVVLSLGFGAFLSHACPCSYREYLTWELIQWYPSLLIGYGIGFAGTLAILRGASRPLVRKLILAALGGSLIFVLSSLWLSPQKRIVSVLLGFLHGPLYDHWIPVTTGLVLGRCGHALAGLSLMSWCAFPKRRIFAYVLALASLTALYKASGYPESSQSLDKLISNFPNQILGPRYIIHYTQEAVPNIQQFHRDVQFHMEELEATIGHAERPVHVFLYPNENVKKIWFGAGETDVADVVTPSVHISQEKGFHSTLRHELVHALMSEHGYHGLGFHPNLALTEGIAVALAPEPSRFSIHAKAAFLLESGKVPSIEPFLSPMFWKQSASQAYTVAGSLVAFLLEKYGFDTVKRLYGGEGLEAILGKGQQQVTEEWRDYVLKQSDKNLKLEGEYLFRDSGIFHEKCFHTKAVLARLSSNVWDRLRQPDGWIPKEDYWPWRIALDVNDREAKLGYLRQKAEISNDPQQRNAVLVEIMEFVNWPPQSIEDAEGYVLASDLLRGLGHVENSIDLLRVVLAQSSDYGYPSYLIRMLASRLEVEVTTADPASWRNFLAGWAPLPPTPDLSRLSWIQAYLVVRNRSNLSLDQLKILAQKPYPKGAPNELLAEWHQFVAERFTQSGEVDLAVRHLESAKSFTTEAGITLIDQKIRRAKFRFP